MIKQAVLDKALNAQQIIFHNPKIISLGKLIQYTAKVERCVHVKATSVSSSLYVQEKLEKDGMKKDILFQSCTSVYL